MSLLDGLIAYWKFDGDSTDELGTHNGTDTGMTYGAEKIGDGARFAASGNVAVAKITNGTVSAGGWVKVGAVPASDRFIFGDRATDRGLFYDGNNNVFRFWDAASYPTVGALTPGTYYHIGFSVAAGVLKTYVNGVASGAGGSGLLWPRSGLAEGFDRFGVSNFGDNFTGSLDEWGVWDRELTPAEWLELYNAGAGLTYEAITTPEVSAKVAGYARQLIDLFPTGRAWSREADAQLTKVRTALADELARVDDRGVDLIEESDPRTATETLADWERVLRIPDEQILTVPAADADRRVAITSKFTGIRGGQNVAFFELLCLRCGYVVTISRYQDQILRSGRARSGDRTNGTVWAYVMKVTVSPPTGAALTHAELEAVVRKHTHSHISVVFEYL